MSFITRDNPKMQHVAETSSITESSKPGTLIKALTLKKEKSEQTTNDTMKPIDEEGRKWVEKTELKTRNIDTLKYVEKKLINKGVQRQDRHPADGIAIGRPPPKSGHGGKFTWEGPADVADNQLMAAPAAMDEGDPNYVDSGEVASELVAEEREGVARVDVDPRLQVK